MYAKQDGRRCLIDLEVNDYLPWNDSVIICIGIMDLETLTTHVFHNENEKDLVTSFIDYYNERDFNLIIGYNLFFDLRYLLSRCLKFGIPMHKIFAAKTVDLLKILGYSLNGTNFNKPGKLGEWSNYLLNKTTFYSNGSIKRLFEENRLEEILSHNLHDLQVTYELYQRIVEIIGEDLC
jgi:DNA polymerase elongation subunit (family B)